MPEVTPARHYAAPGPAGAPSRIAGMLVLIVALAVEVGWILDIRTLKSVIPGLVSMNPMSGVCLILFGLALWLRESPNPALRSFSRFAPLWAVVVGSTKLWDLFWGIPMGREFGFDQWLFRDQLGFDVGRQPNRMAPNTAFNFLMLGIALHASHRRASMTAVYSLSAPTFLLAFLALMGYLFEVKTLYGWLHYVPMALHVSLSFLAVSVGIVYLYPQKGLAGLAASNGPGGILTRRLLPAVIIMPAALGWLKIQGERHELYDPRMGLALVLLCIMAGLIAFIAWSAAILDRMEDSRRRVHEALLEAKRAAEESSQAKSLFLANMSHELRTPLNSIIGFTQILLKNKQGRFLEGDLNFLSRVSQNGRHLLQLINNILDLSKVEAGQMAVVAGPCDVGELVRETLSQLEGQVAGKPLRLAHRLPDAMAMLGTDGGKLKQVLINLVGNAIKFTEKGEVTVTVEADAGSRRPVAITVADTGMGIPPDRLETIFEAFRQLDNGFGRQFEGTGLGLTISRSLCRLMGYGLEVASAPGRGSAFTIVLGERSAAAGAPAGQPVSAR